MKFKKSLALLSAVATTITLAACSSSDNKAASGSGKKGGNYITVDSAEPQNPLIPGNTSETGGGNIIDNIFSGLVSYDANGKVRNEVAESIEANPENTKFTIKLKDWKFSDGTPVTAHSFVDAWNYTVANSQLGSYFFEPIKGYKEGVKELEGLKVIDDKTFTIELSAPEADYTQRLGYSAYFPLPKVAFEDMAKFGEKPVSNGPYKLAEWNHNQDAIIVPDEAYKGDRKPKNDGVKFSFYATKDAAYADLLAGNLDVLSAVPPSAFAVFKNDLGDRAVNQPAAVFQSFTIAQNLEHFSGEEGKLRRQAISYAINRPEITKTIFHDTRTPASDFTSPVLPGWDKNVKGNEVLKYDPTKAKQLWEQANQISPWSGTFQLAYNSDGAHQPWVDATMNSIKNTLGIEATGKPYPDFKSLRNEVKKRAIKSAFRTGWQGDYPSMGNFLSAIYATGAGSNDGDYSNPAFDKLLKEAASAKNTDAAAKKYNEAQELLLQDLPAIPLWYANLTGGYSEKVKNVVFSWKSTPIFYNITKS